MEPAPEPAYNHLVEVLDGAASLRMAICEAEEALGGSDVSEEERGLLEELIEASTERLERIEALLVKTEAEAVQSMSDRSSDDDRDWTERELLEAGRMADEGSAEAEIEVARAIDRIGRSLKVGSAGAIEPFLSHSSPLLRASSLKVLALHWRLKDYADRALWSLASDGEPECRRAAALALGSLYEGSRDRSIGQELVSALERPDEQEDVRWASYFALLQLDGADDDTRPLPIRRFEPSRDVDRSILDRYVRRA